MSVLERLFVFGQKVLTLTDKTEQLARAVEKIEDRVTKIDNRVVRIETLLEMAMRRSIEGPE